MPNDRPGDVDGSGGKSEDCFDKSWEDFYGSSQDLFPSLISIFDEMISSHQQASEDTASSQTDGQNNQSSIPLSPRLCDYTRRLQFLRRSCDPLDTQNNNPKLSPKKPEFPVLRITEPGDCEHVRRTETKRVSNVTTCTVMNGFGDVTVVNSVETSVVECVNKMINPFPEGNSRFCRPEIIKLSSSSASETRRATTEVPLDAFNKRKIVSEERPKSVSSSSGHPSSCSSMSSASLTSTTSSIPRSVCSDGPPPSVAYLASAESLADSCMDLKVKHILELPEPPEESNCQTPEYDWPTWPGRTNQTRAARGDAQSQLRRSAESAESADSGLSLEPVVGATSHEVSHMDRVVAEIIDTERVYVKDLGEIIEGYLRYWQHCERADPFTEEHIDILFGNLETIWNFNRGLLEDLSCCGLDPVEVAKCFVKNRNGFTIYTEYCTNYPNAVSTLTELMRNESIVKSFRERQADLQHALPLGSYLLKPVQRILKYHLLFQNIIKMYDPVFPGTDDLLAAASAMTGIAHHINDMKRRHEHSIRVQEIQSLLYGWGGEDLTTYGELMAEGMFRMCGAKASRHVLLFDKILLICKRKEDLNLVYKAHIHCSNLMLVESVPGEPLSFHVIPFDNPKLQYTLEARCMDQKRDWMLQLKRVILENYQAVIPSHARQILMEIGQTRKGDVTLERSSTRKHHSAPEYLQKRRIDRRSDSSSRLKSQRSPSPKESPILPRRLRRSLGVISRDRSESRDRDTDTESYGSRRSVDSEKPKETRFWRRRSEPSQSFFRSSSNQSDSNPPTIQEVSSNECVNTDSGITEDSAFSDCPDKSESIAELVGQLVMQNVEIQKVLRRRKRSTRFRPPESADIEIISDIETEGHSIKSDTPVPKSIFRKFGRMITREQMEVFLRNLSPQRNMTILRDRVNQRRSSSKPRNPDVRRTRSFSISDINRIDLKDSVINLSARSKIHTSVSLSDLQKHSVLQKKESRPVTIALDHPGDETDSHLQKEFSDSVSMNESVTSISHPDYKIYRRSVSKNSIKSIMQNVGSKFSNLRNGSISSCEGFSVSSTFDDLPEETRTGKMVNVLARQYSRVLKQRIKNIMGESPSPEKKEFNPGNPSAAARMASDYSDYAVPSLLKVPPKADDEDTDKSDSEMSTGSIYERTFEEIESMLDTVRDSAVYSDREDTLSECSEVCPLPKVPPPVAAKPVKIPPQHPEITQIKTESKPTKEGLYATPSLEGLKSIGDRLKDLESWRRENNKSSCDDESETSSQHSTSTINTVLEVRAPSLEVLEEKQPRVVKKAQGNSLPKGWVKQVIGKLQGGGD